MQIKTFSDHLSQLQFFCEADLQSIRCGMFDARSPNEADLQIKSVRIEYTTMIYTVMLAATVLVILPAWRLTKLDAS